MSFYRRFSLPVLLLNGRFDLLMPVASAERWIDTIGTPADDKRLVIYDANHWPLPRNQMIREVIDWLDHQDYLVAGMGENPAIVRAKAIFEPENLTAEDSGNNTFEDC